QGDVPLRKVRALCAGRPRRWILHRVDVVRLWIAECLRDPLRRRSRYSDQRYYGLESRSQPDDVPYSNDSGVRLDHRDEHRDRNRIHARPVMDRAIEEILREFEKRAETESEKIGQWDPAKMGRHLDEFLLYVGPATGQLINLLAKEAKAQ